MNINIELSREVKKNASVVFLENNKNNLYTQSKKHLTEAEWTYIESKLNQDKEKLISLHQLTRHLLFFAPKTNEKWSDKKAEEYRKLGYSVLCYCKENEISELAVSSRFLPGITLKFFIEGLLLGAYEFTKYKSDKKKKSKLKKVQIVSSKITQKQIVDLMQLLKAVCICRDFVNEPVSFLDTKTFCAEVSNLFKNKGATVDVMKKSKLEALQMHGILAVNQGSINAPAFICIEWKPKKHRNKQPVVLIGKGLVFDTGGINIKSATNMEHMKIDMAGGAAVSCAISAIVESQLPVHVIGLIPVTDNRPSGNSLVPGDVIKYSDNTTVEVLNTDAEGRLILADAIIYASKYNPLLVVTIATLTGAAQAAIGDFGTVAMQHNADQYMKKIKEAGNEVYERIVEFPFWEEYNDLIKSDVADIKNIGGGFAGAITAGKFLHHFCKYPFIHLDIAGSAYITKKDSYKGPGATGVGVRLFYEFIKKLSNTQ